MTVGEVILLVVSCLMTIFFAAMAIIHHKKPVVGKLIIEQFEPEAEPIIYLDISPDELDKLPKKISVCFVVENRPFRTKYHF